MLALKIKPDDIGQAVRKAKRRQRPGSVIWPAGFRLRVAHEE